MWRLRTVSGGLYSSEVSFSLSTAERRRLHTAHEKVKVKRNIGMLSQGTRIIIISYIGLKKCTRNLHSLKKVKNKKKQKRRRRKKRSPKGKN